MVGLVDPRDFRELRRFWGFADEPFRVFGVGGVEYAGTLVADCLGQAVVDVSGGMQAQPAVAMFIVDTNRRRPGSAVELPRSSRSGRGSRAGTSSS